MYSQAVLRILQGFASAALFLGLFASGAARLNAMPQDADKTTSVSLGYDLGLAGRPASLIIELDAPEGVRVGTTVNEVTFPTKWLKFEEVRGEESAEVKTTSSVKSDPENKDNSVVQITVTAKQGVVLPNGKIATMVFKVSDDAKGPEVLKLKNVARALSTSVPPSPIEPVTGRDGEIELPDAPPAAYACFFYMH